MSEAGLWTATWTAGTALLGMYVTTRHSLVRALVDRAQRAERERGLFAERAREEKWARLNSEIHDIVTHRVSLLVLQAGALRVSAEEESIRAAAEQMRSVGRLILDELRACWGCCPRTAGRVTVRTAGLRP